MIVLSCASCQKELSVNEEFASKKVKCPECGHLTPIPAQVETPPSLRTKTPGPSAKITAATFQSAKQASAGGSRPAGRSRMPLLLAVAGGLVLALVAGIVVFRLKPQGAMSQRFTNSLGMEFVLVPRGQSWLSESDDQPGLKEIAISQDFYLGVYEVTQEEWEKVMGKNPSLFQEVEGVAKEEPKRFPVESVTWLEAQEFTRRVNEQAKEAALQRLREIRG